MDAVVLAVALSLVLIVVAIMMTDD
jgi:hypothetical protein